jgi:cbb3-type cytochrome oxidase subunit 3
MFQKKEVLGMDSVLSIVLVGLVIAYVALLLPTARKGRAAGARSSFAHR